MTTQNSISHPKRRQKFADAQFQVRNRLAEFKVSYLAQPGKSVECVPKPVRSVLKKFGAEFFNEPPKLFSTVF